jgi:hypothetical protein
VKAFPGVASVVGVVSVLFVESRAPDVEGGGVFGGFSFYFVVMALDGLVSPSVTGHLQAVYRPRDIARRRETTRTSDQPERQARGGFRVFAQVSGLGCIDLGGLKVGSSNLPSPTTQKARNLSDFWPFRVLGPVVENGWSHRKRSQIFAER